METKNRMDLWKAKREKIAQENKEHAKPKKVKSSLSVNQRDLIALELAKMFMKSNYSNCEYDEYLNYYIMAFKKFRADVEETEVKNANEQTIL